MPPVQRVVVVTPKGERNFSDGERPNSRRAEEQQEQHLCEICGRRRVRDDKPGIRRDLPTGTAPECAGGILTPEAAQQLNVAQPNAGRGLLDVQRWPSRSLGDLRETSHLQSRGIHPSSRAEEALLIHTPLCRPGLSDA